MAFQVVLYPSDLTPPPGAFQTLAAEVLVEHGASWVDGPDEGELRLVDGAEIILCMDDSENVAAFALDDQNEAAFDLIHALADRGKGFVTLGSRACAFLQTGDVLAEHDGLFGDPADLPDRRAFGDWMRVAMRESATPPAVAPSNGRPTSLFQQLSDALFGKSI